MPGVEGLAEACFRCQSGGHWNASLALRRGCSCVNPVCESKRERWISCTGEGIPALSVIAAVAVAVAISRVCAAAGVVAAPVVAGTVVVGASVVAAAITTAVIASAGERRSPKKNAHPVVDRTYPIAERGKRQYKRQRRRRDEQGVFHDLSAPLMRWPVDVSHDGSLSLL